MKLTHRILPLLAALFLPVACMQHSAQVLEVAPSPAGSRHAVLLFEDGGVTIGSQTYVAIFPGKAPEIGAVYRVSDLCVVWSAYRADPWKLKWEGEKEITLAVNGRLPRDYEDMIEQTSCEGVHSRWFYEEKAPPASAK